MDLSNQVVRIFGSSPVKIMAEALEQTGRKARLIGQGSPGGWFWFSLTFFVSMPLWMSIVLLFCHMPIISN